MTPRRTSLILLNTSAVLVIIGGGYDAFVPSLPAHVVEFIGVSADAGSSGAVVMARELLRALGGALMAAGLCAVILINSAFRRGEPWAGWAIGLLLIGSEALNAVGMARVGAPFWAPLAFMSLAAAGLGLALLPAAPAATDETRTTGS